MTENRKHVTSQQIAPGHNHQLSETAQENNQAIEIYLTKLPQPAKVYCVDQWSSTFFVKLPPHRNFTWKSPPCR